MQDKFKVVVARITTLIPTETRNVCNKIHLLLVVQSCWDKYKSSLLSATSFFNQQTKFGSALQKSVAIRATTTLNLSCNIVAGQVARFGCSYYRTFRSGKSNGKVLHEPQRGGVIRKELVLVHDRGTPGWVEREQIDPLSTVWLHSLFGKSAARASQISLVRIL